MAALRERMQVYLVRRIKELKSQNWTKEAILQQLGALATKKQLNDLYEGE